MTKKTAGPEMVELPVCPSCNGPMIFTFAFRGKEFACLPCNETDEFFCMNDKRMFPKEEVEALREKWSDDLHRIGATYGGGTCTKAVCGICPPHPYEFKFWKVKKP